MSEQMKLILSIQSHVCYGYVGNRAAVFPLQRLGNDVIAVNTVQFSNHTGYGDWEGDIMTHRHIQDLLIGIEKRGALNKLDAVLSGYLGDAGLGGIVIDTVKKIKQKRNFIYACDPVIGDIGRGIFVKPDVAILFKEEIIKHADIITPNLYELNYLSGMEVRSIEGLEEACSQLHAKGPDTILVTSVLLDDTPKGQIQMYLSCDEGHYIISTPQLSINPAPNGCGDATAAIFLARILEGNTPKVALELTAASIYAIFNATYKAGTRELQIISTQDEIKFPTAKFKAS